MSKYCIIYCLFLTSAFSAFSQSSRENDVWADLSMYYQSAINRSNVFQFTIMNNTGLNQQIRLKGKIQYRNQDLSLSYTARMDVKPGLNMVNENNLVGLQWIYSSTAIRELFNDFNILPVGVYHYCLEIDFVGRATDEGSNSPLIECQQGLSEDLFLIQLIEPENNAKIYEYYPMFSWIVNYPFGNALSYKIRIVEAKGNQNNIAAITRNNPVFQESQLFQNSLVYPAAARKLRTFQPYVWTVDAYYKGILLGGAEPWRFTIIEDSLLELSGFIPAYIALQKEHGTASGYAIGNLKLEYVESKQRQSELKIKLYNIKGKPITMKQEVFQMKLGQNKFELPFHPTTKLRHMSDYYIIAEDAYKQKYKYNFTYINPLYVK